MATSSWQTRPWSSQISPGVFATPRRDVWVYRVFPLAPLEWEDAPKRLELQSKLERFLVELGDSARDLGQGVRTLAQTRSLHIVSVLYDCRTQIPPETPPLLAAFQDRVLFEATPHKALFAGVKLRRDAVAALGNSDSDDSMIKRATKAIKSAAAVPTDLSLFARDYDRVNAMFTRAGAQVPNHEQITQLTSWFNDGEGLDVVIAASSTKFQLTSGRTWQISALMGVEEYAMQMESPGSPWLMDAMNHPEGARAVSIRAELEPPTVTRGRLRHAQRVLRSQEEEELATGDIGRDELGERKDMAKMVENYTRTAGHAWLSKTSVLFAREMSDVEPDETYADVLSGFYGMSVKALEKRQLKALAEMLPGSDIRVNPFSQDVNPAWVAYSGANGFGDVGDPSGLILGSADPHWTNVFVDMYAASNRNKSPIMGIFGEPGSGKAQPLDAKLLTPTGWTTMGQIEVGDLVIGVDGAPTRVSGVFPQGSKDIFKLTFDDGATARSCDEHLWAVALAEVSGKEEIWTVVPLAQLRRRLTGPSGEPLWQIPISRPVEFPEQNLGIDPYGLGLAAARGSAQGSDWLLFEKLLRSSIEQRTRALEGILAGSSTRVEQQNLVTTGVPDELRRPLRELIQGLGGTCQDKSSGSLAFRLRPDSLPVETSSQAFELLSQSGPATRKLVKVEWDSFEPAQCIAVESTRHLYLTDEHIVTHNTFAAQLLTAQAALAGQSAIFINPKGFSSLRPFADWVISQGGQAQVVSMQRMEEEGGAFDPFRFVEPKMAAEILARHINAVLGVTYSGGLTGKQEVELGRGLSEGAIAGARCAFEALQFVRDPDVIEQVTAMVEASTLFALAFGRKPQKPWEAGSGLTLIEFDREMPLPSPGKDHSNFERDERVAVAALRLVSRASLEILMRSNGGILVVDEAHHFLGSSEGLATLDRIGREGRSLGLLPIFATQRVTDLLKVDMESFMSRVLTMKLSDPVEGEAALRLCRLDATSSRLGFLAQAGPGMGFYRDLDDKHSVIQVGAGVPEDLRLAMSTNREDALRRDKKS